jgi:hypothetical protein
VAAYAIAALVSDCFGIDVLYIYTCVL